MTNKGRPSHSVARNKASARNRSLPTVDGLSYLPGTGLHIFLPSHFPSSPQLTRPIVEAAIGDMELDMQEVVLSDSGAAGAFIHGLEDEFFEVRRDSLETL